MRATHTEPEVTPCIICGKVEARTRDNRRGLCNAHYLQFVRERRKATKAGLDLAEWEQDLIARGVLLPVKVAKNAFSVTTDKLKSAPKRKPPKKGDK